MSKSLVYPSKHDVQAVTVLRSSLDGLEPGEFNEIVGFYIQHLRIHYVPEKLRKWKAADGSPPTFAFASTFFVLHKVEADRRSQKHGRLVGQVGYSQYP